MAPVPERKTNFLILNSVLLFTDTPDDPEGFLIFDIYIYTGLCYDILLAL